MFYQCFLLVLWFVTGVLFGHVGISDCWTGQNEGREGDVSVVWWFFCLLLLGFQGFWSWIIVCGLFFFFCYGSALDSDSWGPVRAFCIIHTYRCKLYTSWWICNVEGIYLSVLSRRVIHRHHFGIWRKKLSPQMFPLQLTNSDSLHPTRGP